MSAHPVKTGQPERRYDLDWLRVLAILVVFIFHSSRFFDQEGWHVKNATMISTLFRTRKHRLCLATLLLLVACAPMASSTPTVPAAPAEPATPTPEVFIPLDSSPTSPGSDLPLTCQVTDLNVYIDRAAGYCFAYPHGFTLGDQPSDRPSVLGPPPGDDAEPVRAGLEITTHPVPEGSDLARLVDAYLGQTSLRDAPQPIERSSLMLGGAPAERLEAVPGQLSSRVVLALHGGTLFMLRFQPSDVAIVAADLEALFQTVSGSFAFLEGPAPAHPGHEPQTISWHEFDRKISLAFDPVLAPWVEAGSVPAVPVSGEILFSESHPRYAQFRFLGFQGGRPYDLPLLPVENGGAQVMVFRTADFAGFGDDVLQGFPGQWQALTDLLQSGVNADRCAQPLYEYDQALPFLPWVNSRQTFCAQPQVINFAGGKGIRYLTFYAQGLSPALEHQIFYTFQGLTDDGQFYIAADFPVTSGVFPTEPPEAQALPDSNYLPMLTEQVTRLNRQPGDRFGPGLATLDALVGSIRIEAP